MKANSGSTKWPRTHIIGNERIVATPAPTPMWAYVMSSVNTPTDKLMVSEPIA